MWGQHFNKSLQGGLGTTGFIKYVRIKKPELYFFLYMLLKKNGKNHHKMSAMLD